MLVTASPMPANTSRLGVWEPFVSDAALVQLRRRCRRARTRSFAVAQILEFMIMNDQTVRYGSRALAEARKRLRRLRTDELLSELSKVSQSDTTSRRVLRLGRAMVFASEVAQVDAISVEIGEEARKNRTRTLAAVRQIQARTGRRPDDFTPSDLYAILHESRRSEMRRSRPDRRGANIAIRPKQYWALSASYESYVRQRVVEHSLSALGVVTYFEPSLVDRVARDGGALSALLDMAYVLTVDASAGAAAMMKPFDVACFRLDLVGPGRTSAGKPRPARVRDHSDEGAGRRKDHVFVPAVRTSIALTRGMNSVDDETPASPILKLVIDRLRDTPRPRLY